MFREQYVYYRRCIFFSFYRNSKEVAMLQLLTPLKPNLYINFMYSFNNITHNLDSVLKYDLKKLNQKMQLHKSFKIWCLMFCGSVLGGWHASTENTNKVECFNPRTNQWTQKASLSERRYRPGVAVVGGKIYVCGGEEGWDR